MRWRPKRLESTRVRRREPIYEIGEFVDPHSYEWKTRGRRGAPERPTPSYARRHYVHESAGTPAFGWRRIQPDPESRWRPGDCREIEPTGGVGTYGIVVDAAAPGFVFIFEGWYGFVADASGPGVSATIEGEYGELVEGQIG